MAELWQFYDSFKCTICYMDYTTSKIPLQLCKNRHMICVSCLDQLKRVASDERKPIVCPFCKECFKISTVRENKRLLEIKAMTVRVIQNENKLNKSIKDHKSLNIKLEERASKYLKQIDENDKKDKQTSEVLYKITQKMDSLLEKIQTHRGKAQQQRVALIDLYQSINDENNKAIEQIWADNFALREENQRLKRTIDQQTNLKEKTQQKPKATEQLSSQPYLLLTYLQFVKTKNQQRNITRNITKKQNWECPGNNTKQTKALNKHHFASSSAHIFFT